VVKLWKCSAGPQKARYGFVRFWATWYLWVSGHQYAFMLLIQTAYQKVKGLGLPCAVVLRILAGVVLDVRANGAASGLKQGGGSARGPCLGQWFISGYQHHISGSPAYTYTQNAENGSSGCRAVSQRSCTGPPHQAQVVYGGKVSLGERIVKGTGVPESRTVVSTIV